MPSVIVLDFSFKFAQCLLLLSLPFSLVFALVVRASVFVMELNFQKFMAMWVPTKDH